MLRFLTVLSPALATPCTNPFFLFLSWGTMVGKKPFDSAKNMKRGTQACTTQPGHTTDENGSLDTGKAGYAHKDKTSHSRNTFYCLTVQLTQTDAHSSARRRRAKGARLLFKQLAVGFLTRTIFYFFVRGTTHAGHDGRGTLRLYRT